MNDIDKCALNLGESGGISLFADDTKIHGTNPNDIQVTLCKIDTWLKSRQLNLAPEKCVLLQIKQRGDPVTFKIQNNNLDTVDFIKDLGITVSNNLKWANHIDQIYRNASNYSYNILKFTKTTNIWNLLKFYTVYIRPKLEYGTQVWSPNLLKDIHKIEKIQKYFTRQIFQRCNIKYTSYANRLYQLNIKSLEYRRTFFDAIFIFKILHGLSGLNFSDFFLLKTSSYGLRDNSFKIETLLSYPTSEWQNSFFCRGAKLWNALPEDLRCATSLDIFKQKLHKFDLNLIKNLVYP